MPAPPSRIAPKACVFKWLVPEGAKIGEKFGVWCGDTLYTCERVNSSDFSITESQRAQKA